MVTNDPAEAVRKRTRQLLRPFLEEFREPPDGASADQLAALGTMSGGALPAAVDECMRVVGGDGDAVGLLFAGQDSFDAATAIDEGPLLLVVAARYGAAPALLETAIPYTSSDQGVWWLGPDQGEAVIDPFDPVVWSITGGEEPHRHGTFTDDLAGRVNRALVGLDELRGRVDEGFPDRHRAVAERYADAAFLDAAREEADRALEERFGTEIFERIKRALAAGRQRQINLRRRLRD